MENKLRTIVLKFLLTIALLLVFAYFIYPTRYYYHYGSDGVYRIDRITGILFYYSPSEHTWMNY